MGPGDHPGVIDIAHALEISAAEPAHRPTLLETVTLPDVEATTTRSGR